MRGMWFGTMEYSPNHAHKSRLLIRVKYSNLHVKIERILSDTVSAELPTGKKTPQDISQVTLNMDRLFKALTSAKGFSLDIERACDRELCCRWKDTRGSFDELVQSWAKNEGVNQVNLLEKWGGQTRRQSTTGMFRG